MKKRVAVVVALAWLAVVGLVSGAGAVNVYEEAWQSGQGTFLSPTSVSVQPADRSCWVADHGHLQVVHLSPSGEELWRSAQGMFACPYFVSALPDGSCWVGDGDFSRIFSPTNSAGTGGSLTHISSSGEVIGSPVSGIFNEILSVCANPTDGSCWVIDLGNLTPTFRYFDSVVRHFSATGECLWQSKDEQFSYARSISVNSADGSCWVADTFRGEVVHLASDGTELWRSAPGVFGETFSVAVNPTDGSCWVVTGPGGSPSAILISSSGAQLLSTTQFHSFFSGYDFLAANATDGSCWLADGYNCVYRVSVTGAVWRSPKEAFTLPLSVCVDQSDGSCWVADYYSNQISHWTPVAISFSDVDSSQWAYNQIMACAEAGVVIGYADGNYRPEETVTRDQMAVYIARACCGGDTYVPAMTTFIFPDVPTDYWAFKYVEFAWAARIVNGYPDGDYKPLEQVTRDQMAVFIARSIVTPRGDANVPSPAPGTQTFPDVAPEFWAYKYIEYCQAQSVVQGYPDGKYEPGNVVTRDQMAVFVARAFQLTM